MVKPSELAPAVADFFEKYIPQYLDQVSILIKILWEGGGGEGATEQENVHTCITYM